MGEGGKQLCVLLRLQRRGQTLERGVEGGKEGGGDGRGVAEGEGVLIGAANLLQVAVVEGVRQSGVQKRGELGHVRRLEEEAVGLQCQFVLYGEEKDEKKLSERGSIRAYTARQSAIIAGVKAKASILEAMTGVCSVVASTQHVRCPRAVRCGGFGSASSSWWTRRRRLA